MTNQRRRAMAPEEARAARSKNRCSTLRIGHDQKVRLADLVTPDVLMRSPRPQIENLWNSGLRHAATRTFRSSMLTCIRRPSKQSTLSSRKEACYQSPDGQWSE